MAVVDELYILCLPIEMFCAIYYALCALKIIGFTQNRMHKRLFFILFFSGKFLFLIKNYAILFFVFGCFNNERVLTGNTTVDLSWNFII